MRGPYVLEVEGVGEFDADECAMPRHYDAEYNAGMLQKGARAVAARLSRELDATVEVFGYVGTGRAKQRVLDSVFAGGRR